MTTVIKLAFDKFIKKHKTMSNNDFYYFQRI